MTRKDPGKLQVYMLSIFYGFIRIYLIHSLRFCDANRKRFIWKHDRLDTDHSTLGKKASCNAVHLIFHKSLNYHNGYDMFQVVAMCLWVMLVELI